MRFKKIVLAGLVATTALGLASCGGQNNTATGTPGGQATSTVPAENLDSLGIKKQATDEQIYQAALGDFYNTYSEAKAITDDDNKRFVMMAKSEAEFLAAAVMLPTTTQGGNYAIGCVAPRSVPFAQWGNDLYRLKNTLVLDKKVTAEDRAAMITNWNNNRGTDGYDYLTWAKEFLASKGYNLKNTYNTGYSSDLESWDILATSKAVDSEPLVNTYDGLLEYDQEGELQPALAESYTVSEDGLTYTFKIRKNATWVDVQGTKLADVKADDFVAGFQHMLDAAGGLEYLVQGVIVNANEYISGEVDFDEVGVKAIDEYTVEYKLCEKKSYFTTMLGYGVFAPMSRTVFEAFGGKFGAEYDPEAETYTYGKGRDSIAYCGPYRITEATAKNKITFTKNDSYWDVQNVDINTINWLYNDGTDKLKAYNDMKSGVLDTCGLNTAALAQAKTDDLFNTYAYTTDTDTTTFSAFYNLKRQTYALTDGSCPSDQTDDQKLATYYAMNNVHFRRAISFAVDRVSYNAQSVGTELAALSIRNTYTPGNFVNLTAETTFEGKTFKAGTLYGEMIQYYLDEMGVAIKAFDAATGSSDGYDGWYNVENAKAEMAKAVEELKAKNVNVTKENPIIIDFPYYSAAETYTNRANSYKQSLEASLEGLVKINLVACETSDNWYNCGYFTSTGAEANYDMYDVSGWGPDYGDPSTYLDTMLPDFAGYMTKCLGIY